MSPIAVTKTVAPAPSSKSSGSLNNVCKTSPPVPSTSKTSVYFRDTSESQSAAAASGKNSNHKGATSTNPSSGITDEEKARGWSTERLTHAKAMLVKTLESYRSNGSITEKIYNRILERALTKVCASYGKQCGMMELKLITCS
ncbi:unnamed protein product [Echinostoma caproni]|uniref:KIX_2 domain-containing protein n=1 Tax=Echinostoma caproni TaxID=27848 RepID=A0A183AU94_9TREM|nr:unnamed protein product [Echinostoma caproni]